MLTNPNALTPALFRAYLRLPAQARAAQSKAAQLKQAALTRDARGRFDVRNFDTLCVCGHTLGVHLAAKPRDCMECEGAYLCDGFVKSRAASVRK